MSAPATPAAHESPSAPETANAVATPDFDSREKSMFGQDDARAVTVIGKMLVGFFFYSLLIMSAVAIWTLTRGGQVDPHAQTSHHTQDDE